MAQVKTIPERSKTKLRCVNRRITEKVVSVSEDLILSGSIESMCQSGEKEREEKQIELESGGTAAELRSSGLILNYQTAPTPDYNSEGVV